MTFQQVAQQFESATGLHAQLRLFLAVLDLSHLRTDRIARLVGDQKAIEGHLATIARDIIQLGEALEGALQRMKAGDLGNAADYDVNITNVRSQVDLAHAMADMFPLPAPPEPEASN